MTITGISALLLGLPLVVGLLVCGAGGVYLMCQILDWAIERWVYSRDCYQEFLAFAWDRRQAKKRAAKATQSPSQD